MLNTTGQKEQAEKERDQLQAQISSNEYVLAEMSQELHQAKLKLDHSEEQTATQNDNEGYF